jgi:hypothetical protein
MGANPEGRSQKPPKLRERISYAGLFPWVLLDKLGLAQRGRIYARLDRL